jgi:hypothetical protein
MPLAAYTANYTKIQKPKSGARLSLTRKPDVLGTDIVLNRMPDIFSWLPIGGDNSTFQVNTSFESHPSGSFSFVTKAENRLYLETALPNGAEFEAFGIGWTIKSLTIAEIPASDQPIRPILVNVSLGGKYENYVSVPIAYVKSAPKTDQGVDGECQGAKSEKKPPKPKTTSVGAIARQAGVKFSAPGSWKFKIPTDDSTTIANKLGELQFSNKCFIDYSDPEKITAIEPESVKQWEIGEDLVIGGVSTSYQSKSPVFNQVLSRPKALNFEIKSGQMPGTAIAPSTPPIQKEPPPILSDYFWPRYKLDGIEKQEAEIEEEPTQSKEKPRFRRVPPTAHTLVSGDVDPTLPPGGGTPTDINQNFDQSGPKKTRKTTDYLNGQEVRSVVEIFGYVIYGEFSCFWNSSESKWKKLFPGGAWTLVSRIETKQNFETKYGFNVGYTSKGWELVRFRQESADVPETAIATSLSSRDLTSDNVSPLLSGAKSDEVVQLDESLVRGFLGQISNLYRFVQNATIEEQVKTLVPESSLFITDVVTELESTDKICLPNGKSALSNEPDPNYVPPYVLIESNTFKSNYLREFNPEYQLQYHVNTDLELSEEDRQSRTIDPWVFTGSASLEQFKLDISNDVEGQESYTTYQSSYSSSGPSFGLKLQQATYEQKLGRPSIESAPMAEVFTRIEDEEIVDKEGKEAEEPYEHYVESILVEDTPTGSKNLSGGNLSYTNCDTASKAQSAANFDLWLRNIKGIGTKTLTIAYNKETSQIKVGDIVILTINNIKGKYRVTALSFTLKIHGTYQDKNLVTSEGINLTLVPEPVIELKYTKERPKKGKYSGKSTGAVMPGALSSISKLSGVKGRF